MNIESYVNDEDTFNGSGTNAWEYTRKMRRGNCMHSIGKYQWMSFLFFQFRKYLHFSNETGAVVMSATVIKSLFGGTYV